MSSGFDLGFGPGDILQGLSDDVVGGDAVGLGFEVEDQPMPQSCVGDIGDVVEGDVGASVAECGDLGGEHYRLCTARAGPVLDVFSHRLRGVGSGGVCRCDKAGDVPRNVRGDGHLADQRLELLDAGGVGDLLGDGVGGGGGSIQNGNQFPDGGGGR